MNRSCTVTVASQNKPQLITQQFLRPKNSQMSKTKRKESIFSQMAQLPERLAHMGTRRKQFGQVFE